MMGGEERERVGGGFALDAPRVAKGRTRRGGPTRARV